jgi:uncharacterized protein YjbJ (UPF0337 family)
MSWAPIEARWDYVKADAKAEWGRLTDMDLEAIAGHRDELVARVAERYGATKANVEPDVEQWAARMRAKIAAMDRARGLF